MTPKDFCNWFRGVLDFKQDESGSVTFTMTEVMKIEDRLKKALESDAPGSALPRPPRPDGGATRC